MADEPNRNDYRNARAEMQAARARERALRPWYRKKRFIFGIPLAALVLLSVVVAATAPEEESGTAATSGGQATSGTASNGSGSSAAVPRLGDTVRVGDLDLTIRSVERQFDSTPYNMFNQANTRVRVVAVNARGPEDRQYAFSPYSALKLVDTTGVAHDPAFGCAGCPEDLGVSVELIRGGRAEGWVYYEIPDGVELTELLYQPLFSTNRTRIQLR